MQHVHVLNLHNLTSPGMYYIDTAGVRGLFEQMFFFLQRDLRGPPPEADSFSFNMRHIARAKWLWVAHVRHVANI